MSLPTSVRDIGHGVRICSQDQIKSKTLVCYLDANEVLHYGFAYPNGSNVCVVCWENNKRRNKTIPRGASIIEFREEVTTKKSKDDFYARDFEFSWLDTAIVKDALKDLKFEAVVKGMGELAISKKKYSM